MSQPGSTQVRTFVFDLEARAAGDDAIPVVVSTDAVVEVSDGPEILVHSSDAIDLQRAPLPIIATHRSGQVNVGIIDNLQVSGGQLRGTARFGTRQEAAEYKADVLNRIIRSVSVGYARIKARFRADGVLVTERWMPTHTALVAEPADINAGFFRSIGVPAFELEPRQQITQSGAPASTKGVATMADQNAAAGAIADPQVPAQAQADQQRALPQQAASNGDRALEMERNRRRGIENLCKANKIDDNLREYWVSTGLSVEAITDDLLKVIEERGKNNPQSDAKLGLTDAETRRYSIFNAVRAVADKNWTSAGFELEASRAIAQKLGRTPDPHKFYVPFEVQQRALPVPQRRDLTVASSSGGGYLVATNNMSFIDILRNRSVAYRMGARRLSGLVGSVTVPKQTAAATAVWLSSESATATESAQTFGQMALSPKTVGAYTEISRQLLLQSSPDAEAIVTSDLGSVCALAVDVGVLRGSGASGEPTGIVTTSGVGTVSGTSFDYADVLEFQSDVAAANVQPVSGGYVTTPAVAVLAMTRSRFANTDTPLWAGNLWDGQMAGFPAMSSNQMAAGTMLFGDWSQVIVGEWGVLEVEVNPYANFQAGIIGIRAMVSMDVGLRYAAAFSYGAAMT
jgi:HK97 family phage major capsid protein